VRRRRLSQEHANVSGTTRIRQVRDGKMNGDKATFHLLLRMLAGATATFIALAYVEFDRRAGTPTPVPFLMLYAGVVLTAWLGGIGASLPAATLVAGYIIYAGTVPFGPATLTGGIAQISIGIALYLFTAVFLGRNTDRLRRALAEQQSAKNTLEQLVKARTAELSASNEALLQSEARFRDFSMVAADWYWEMDADLRFSYFTPKSTEHLGSVPEQLIGYTREELMDPQTAALESSRRHFADLAARRPFEGFEYPFRGTGGLTRICLVNGKPIIDAQGVFHGYRGSVRDVTQARAMSEKLAFQSTHDALTGLANRRVFEERLGELLESARTDQLEHALCYIDLDQFKIVNDTCGHAAGDALLRQISDLIHGTVRRSDLLARLGGDEFGLLMERCSVDRAEHATEIMLREIKNFRFMWSDKTFTLSASVGLVPIDHTATSATDLLSAADAACYTAKELGRNRIHTYHHKDAELSERRGQMQWIPRLNAAREAGRLRLYAQTITALSTPQPDGLWIELLLRVLDEDDQIIPPGAFLPAAERYGLAPEIDRWVVQATIDWLKAHPEVSESISLCAINLSGHSLTDSRFLDFAVPLLEGNPSIARKLCFEITESAVAQSLAEARRLIYALRSLGCQFALDDFGTGFSSFAYLKSLPVNFLKIDGGFVRDMARDSVDQAMVRTINELGHAMGYQTIAEHVEDEATLALLRDLHIDHYQGFLNGIPVPIDELSVRTAPETA
jgi:diguanylate cyclase (GGDEF)-like protein/PAS domain S-box-containing protein